MKELKAIKVTKEANDYAINADRICRGRVIVHQPELDRRWARSLKDADGYRHIIDKVTFITPLEQICEMLDKAGYTYIKTTYEEA